LEQQVEIAQMVPKGLRLVMAQVVEEEAQMQQVTFLREVQL
jgi:hypothetical protein